MTITFDPLQGRLTTVPDSSALGNIPSWAATTYYILDQEVQTGGKFYSATVSHTSGSDFATDLAAGKWVEISKATHPVLDDKNLTLAGPTSGDDANTGLSITSTPFGDGYVSVEINGVEAEIGDAVKTKECYFSGDGGTTARLHKDITASDVLFWNGVISGYDLSSTDKVSFFYSII